MARILIPTRSANDWRALLADPDLHWQERRSAWSLAHHWERAGGRVPDDVATALGTGGDNRIAPLEMVLAIPEHQTFLPGGGLPSQNDLFVLGRGCAGRVATVVEAKVTETFGPTVAKWLHKSPELARRAPDDPTPVATNRERRLAGLLDLCALGPGLPDGGNAIRYQLIHRTAAAVLEARRYGAVAAVMLVQSFDPGNAGFADYATFCALFGLEPERSRVHRATVLPDGLPLFVGWVSSEFPSPVPST